MSDILDIMANKTPLTEEELRIKRQKHADYMREYTRKNNEKVNAQRRARRSPEKLEVERAWRKNNPERVKEYKRRDREVRREMYRQWNREYEARWRDKLLARERERYHKNIDKERARSREKYQRTKDKVRVRGLRYRTENKERLKARWKELYLANHRRETARRRIHGHIRRAKLRAVTTERVDLEAILVRDCGMCGICKKPVHPDQLNFDHIIPISKGGPHCADNLQVTHEYCNKSKGAKYPMLSPH